MVIEVLLKDKKIIKAQSAAEISIPNQDFHVMQFLGYTNSDLQWLENNFSLDFTIMKHFDDIEISSHFLEDDSQASFHFSIPYYNEEKKLVEQPMFIIISKTGLFLFSSTALDSFLNEGYLNKHIIFKTLSDMKSIFKSQVAVLADYFADLTENSTRKIKTLANTILIEKEYTSKEMDVISSLKFNNILIKEALIETTRVFNLYMKSNWEHKLGLKESMKAELNDLNVISDYIQFNFDRLDDLKENVSGKIELEQSHFFKLLTVVTVCISLPTLIAGIYGMNFEQMPGLKMPYGYPAVLIAMIISAVLPFIYFKKKKWL
ncbi:MAG: magnesium transporter [Chitinophagaceae bacterium]|nr:MAG: magnesium transporter [Chitinophagaceae bacterium]